MARLTVEGKFYLHLIVLDLILLAFVILKRMDVSDPSNTGELTSDQVMACWGLAVVGAVSFALAVIRGSMQGVTSHRGLSTFALVIVVVGLLGIFAMLGFAKWYRDDTVAATPQILILVSTVLAGAGSAIYVGVNFPEDIEDRRFKEALREEIRSLAGSARGRRARQAAAPEGVEVAPIEETPGESASAQVINCDKCSQALKVPAGRRPVAVKCVKCGAIQVVG